MAENIDLRAEATRVRQRLDAMVARDPALMPPDLEVTAKLLAPDASYVDMVSAVLAGYADRPALGVRASEIRTDADGRRRRHYLPAYRTISYGTLRSQIEAIACAWRDLPEFRVAPGDFVAYISFTGAEMTAIDLATVYTQAISVPLQANLPAADMTEVLKDVDPATLVASIDNLALAVDYAIAQDTIRSLIVIDADPDDGDERDAIAAAAARLAEAGGRVTLVTFADLVTAGSGRTWTPLPRSPEGDQALSMIMYTSGSTGTPKGALIHERVCLQFWTDIDHKATVAMAYAPMNHFVGRSMIYSTLAQGGTAYFSLKSDLSTLLEDIRLARPTNMTFMPRFAEMIYQRYQAEVQRRVSEGEQEAEADATVRAEMRASYLGNRMVSGATGSSPTAPEVRAFIRECFDLMFVDGYGSTESSGSGSIVANRVLRNVVIDYKLRDVPELGYYLTDKPYPRGELLMKTIYQIKGYFKRPEATAAIFDEDGYVITGDIMEELGPDQLRWVDRRNNVIKLSQMEFVAIAPVEAAFLGKCQLIHQIYVYGSSYRAFLLAVVVPAMDIATARLGRTPNDDELRSMILSEMAQAAHTAGLKSFEIPRDILIEHEPFTLENGLLSSVRKPLRPNLKRRYADALEAMYQDMDRKQQEELSALRQNRAGLSVQDRVAAAFKANLGVTSINADEPRCYRDLGGDSLGGVSLSLLLEEMFSVEVPVSLILGPTASIGQLARYIDAELTGESQTPTFARVHGADATEARASDLILDKFMDEAALAAVASLPAAPAEAKVVLLTGSTGFLGRFLALEWMERVAPRGGKVICAIRASSAEDGRRRLDETFGTIDPALTEHFATLAKDHLEVLASDLEAPRLGLDEARYRALAEEVDQIVHPGALVNHLFTYQNLFGPNVAGTAELIRLALTGRQKRFDYVSTVAVPAMNPGLHDQGEDVDVRVFAPAMPLSDQYAMGYAASKWAGEVLLRDAHERFGLPVNVFRADMILPHARYLGQINVPDMFTRMLRSLVATGIAPGSFYQREGSDRPRAHYDGLPVDFLAAAMQQIGDRANSGYHTFNTINAHYDDGVSLDSFVDWIMSDGYPVERLEDYPTWFTRFKDKHRQLTDDERQHSLINILGPYEHPAPVHTQGLASARFVEAVRSLPVGPDIPHLTEGFIHKYLADMRALGLLPARAGEAAGAHRHNEQAPA